VADTSPAPARGDFDLTGRVAVVTGGAGFLGGAFSRALAEYGAQVVVGDLDAAACDKVAGEVARTTGGGALGLAADVGNATSVQRLVDEVVRHFGRLDVLVNNAAARSPRFFEPFESYSLTDWNEVMRVNVTGVFLCSQAAGRQMLQQGSGSIINIASVYAAVAPDQRIYEGVPFNTPAVYSASKAAVVGMTRYLAAYWGARNVRVNAISPGGVERAEHPRRFVGQYAARVPLGRMGRERDLRGALVFLASDASAYVTGQEFLVDGGLTAW